MRDWEPDLNDEPLASTTTANKAHQLNPPIILAIGFLLLILSGTVVLKLPIVANHPVTWMEALFTATSAVTVTGLLTIDISAYFNIYGQVIILFLIQAGGLGFMTFAVVGATMLGARLGMGQQRLAQEAFNEISLDNVTRIAKTVLLYSLMIEAFGIIWLVGIWSDEMSLAQALYQSTFYAISAFNNAGFALGPNSLVPYASDIGVNLVISALFIIGGIGFSVLIDLNHKRSWSKLQTNTRIILLATLYLNLIAFLLIWIIESQNPATLGAMSLKDQVLAAWFQATAPRTAGFNTIPMEQMKNTSIILILFLMFVGGGSLSTASGIKIGSCVVILMTTVAFLRKQEDITVLNRTIPIRQVMKAIAIVVCYVLLMFLGIFILDLTEEARFLDILFEVISALSTVGLSRGLTTHLSPAGQFVMILLMIAGRLGPLTLAYTLAKPNRSRVRYAEANIQVG